MTMAAVAFMPLIWASSSSERVTSEAAVGDSPLGPVLYTWPSGVAAGVASLWRANATRGATAEAPAAATISAENRRRFRDLSTGSSLISASRPVPPLGCTRRDAHATRCSVSRVLLPGPSGPAGSRHQDRPP